MKSKWLFLVCLLSLNALAVPNPASVNCAKKKGKLEILDSQDGQYGLCSFGSAKIEEWTLLRHNQGETQTAVMILINGRAMVRSGEEKCLKFKGKLSVDKSETGADVSVCEFKDGSKIETKTLFAGSAAKSNKKLMQALK